MASYYSYGFRPFPCCPFARSLPSIPLCIIYFLFIYSSLQCASEALRSDLQGWQRQKKTDVKLLLVEMAKRHMLFYEKSLSAWEAVLPSHTPAISVSKKSTISGGGHSLMGNGDVELLRQVASALAPELPEEDNTEPSKDSSDWENVDNAAAI